jgi:hypothetical protein
MKNFAILRIACVLSLALGLVACESNPPHGTNAAPAKSELQFADLQGFDRDLAGSLSSPLPKVDVAFYDRIAPSALPERLQRWMASVEAGGGSVTVVPPESSVTAKSPMLLISAASTLWSATKIVKEYAAKAVFDPAHKYDAQIILKQDDKGESLVDKVVFVKRKP